MKTGIKRATSTRKFWVTTAIPILVIVVLGTSFSSNSIFLRSSASANTPIQHVVIIMQENHAFDNLFGAFPGLAPHFSVLGPDVYCDPYQLSKPSNCVKPWNGDSMSATIQKTDMGHSWTKSHQAYNGGAMNGFVAAQSKYGTNANYAMAYYTNYTIPDYWDWASYFSLDANFFSSELSYSYPNHLYLVAAQSGGCEQCKPSNNLQYETLATELTNAGVSWKYYAGNWNTKDDCKSISSGGVGYWNVLPDFPAIQLNSATCGNIQNLNNLYSDINSGNLPNVAWVTPIPSNSDHPGSSTLTNGQEYVSTIIDGIESHSSLWSSTVIFLSWDDFGGYSDHILPNAFADSGSTSCGGGSCGYGFRVPLIVISPYVKHGGIFYGPGGTTTQEDFTAILATIEQNWGLHPLTQRDAAEASLFYMLNFAQTPLPPLILPTSSLATYPYQTCSTCKFAVSMPIHLAPIPASVIQIGNYNYTINGDDDVSD
jgi:phospholipase C